MFIFLESHTNILLFSVFRPNCHHLECAADFSDCVACVARTAVLLASQTGHPQSRAVQGARQLGGG